MLRHRESMLAVGLAVPTGDAGQPVRDVLDLDVERRGVEQVEPPPAQHALPGPRSRSWLGTLCIFRSIFMCRKAE